LKARIKSQGKSQAGATVRDMATSARRGHGEGSIYPDAVNGTWASATSPGWTLDGKRIRRKVTGHELRPVITTSADVMDKIFI
jgi:hypothetical protein